MIGAQHSRMQGCLNMLMAMLFAFIVLEDFSIFLKITTAEQFHYQCYVLDIGKGERRFIVKRLDGGGE